MELAREAERAAVSTNGRQALETAQREALRETAAQVLREAGFQLVTDDPHLFPYARPDLGALGPGGALFLLACRLGPEVAQAGAGQVAGEVRRWVERNYATPRRPKLGAGNGALSLETAREILDQMVAEELELPWERRRDPEEIVRQLETVHGPLEGREELLDYVRLHRYRRVKSVHRAAVVLGAAADLGPEAELPGDLQWIQLDRLDATFLAASLWPTTRGDSPYLQYLPGIYQGDPFLRRFLQIFDPVLSSLEETLDNVVYYLDPLTTPAGFLNWLGGWVGIEPDESWPLARRRQLVRWAAEILRWRGTRRGLRLHLRAYSGARPLIVDSFDGLRLGSEAALGWNTALGTPIMQGFSVTLCVQEPQGLQETVLRGIIEGDKPAHTTYVLHLRPRPAPSGD